MNHHPYYILDERGEPRQEPDMAKWGKWLHTADRKVCHEEVNGAVISTVFLAIDHNYNPDGPPVLWESMVFNGPLHNHQMRCSGSREQAEAMHEQMKRRVLSLSTNIN